VKPHHAKAWGLWQVDIDKIQKLGDKTEKYFDKTQKLGDKTEKCFDKTQKLDGILLKHMPSG